MRWTPSDDHIALLCIAALVVTLLIVRSCIPSNLHHPAELRGTQSTSSYEHGG
jgi:hypothetical protein